jgi:hypothetical protein
MMMMRRVQYEDAFGIPEIETFVGPCCCRTGIRVPTFGSTKATRGTNSESYPA